MTEEVSKVLSSYELAELKLRSEKVLFKSNFDGGIVVPLIYDVGEVFELFEQIFALSRDRKGLLKH